MPILTRSSSCVTGLAQDVVIVIPSNTKSTSSNTSLLESKVSSSDFTVQFTSSSSTTATVSSIKTPANKKRQTSSSTTNGETSSSSSPIEMYDDDNPTTIVSTASPITTGRDDGLRSFSIMRGSFKKSFCNLNSITCLPKSNNRVNINKGIVRIKINGVQIPELTMMCNLKEQQGYCYFENKNNESTSKNDNINNYKPDSSLLSKILENNTTLISYNKINKLEYNYCIVETSEQDFERDEEETTDIVISTAQCNLYIWSVNDSIIVSDIDGTVTCSDIKGVYDTIVTETYDYAHAGICRFFTNLSNSVMSSSSHDNNNSPNKTGTIRFLYLTARPISLITSTRKYIHSLTQMHDETIDKNMQQKYKLPSGPIFCHKGNLLQVLYQELIAKDVDTFKANLLLQQIVLPFKNASATNSDDNEDIDIFLAAFGNKYTDASAYAKAGVHLSDIFIINKKSEIMCLEHCPDHNNDDNTTNRGIQSTTSATSNQSSVIKYASKWKKSISSSFLLSNSTTTSSPRAQLKRTLTDTSAFKRSLSKISIKKSQYRKDLYKSYNDPNLYHDTLSKIQYKFIAKASNGNGSSLSLVNANENDDSSTINNCNACHVSYSSMEGTEILKTYLSSPSINAGTTTTNTDTIMKGNNSLM